MARFKFLYLIILIGICLISALLLHAQELPDAFNTALSDISLREGRTVTREQLFDYSYREILDDFFSGCGVNEPLITRYYVISALTDRLNDYTYHITSDGSRLQFCSVERILPTATPTVDLTRITATPTLVPTATETRRPGALRCPGFLYSRLKVGEQGRVLPGEIPNRLREQPSADSPQIRVIPPGQTFDVLRGPRCDRLGSAWWQVRYLDTIGWTVEGEGQEYYVEPVIIVPNPFATNTPFTSRDSSLPTATSTSTPSPTFTQAPACPGSFVSRLVLYGTGQVTPGEPNNLRNRPNTTATIIGIIQAGEPFQIAEGPQCDSEGRVWWRVNYNGKLGWTVEGQGTSYFIEPVN